MKALTLYELASEYERLAELLNDPETNDNDILVELDKVQGDLQTKIANITGLVKNLESFAAQIREAEKAMAKRRKAAEGRAESIRGYLKWQMQSHGMTKVESPYFAVSLKRCPPAVEVIDEGLVPAKFWRRKMVRELDKKAIMEALKAGEDVPGCRLNQDETVTIR